MIEEFAKIVPDELLDRSGKVFYAGRTAFSIPSRIYVLGANPVGDPKNPLERTIREDLDHVLREMPSEWSAYRDEAWAGTVPGSTGFQACVLRMLLDLGVDPRQTPSSNLHFVRSRSDADLADEKKRLAELCWPFHDAVIQKLRIDIVVCLGVGVGRWVRDKLAAHEPVATFVEANGRRWTSEVHRSAGGALVASLTHPSRAHWTKTATNPTPMLKALLEGREAGAPL